MPEPQHTTEVAAKIEAFRAEVAILAHDRRRHRRIDGVPVVVAVIPDGIRAELRLIGALVGPGRVALEWALR